MRIAIAVAAVAAVVSLVPFAVRSLGRQVEVAKSAPPTSLSQHSLDLAAALDKEPCDRSRVVELCEAVLRDGEPRYCLTRSDQFFDKCGDFWRLRWLTYESHKRLSEWDAAVAEASKLVDYNPDDSDYRWWRGIAYAEKGDFAHAAEDYEQAIAIKPQITSIPFNLADAYRHLGRPCDGVFPLEELAYFHPEGAANARRRLAQLYDDPRCSDRRGTGQATIPYREGSRGLRSKVTINGVDAGEFVIDTGASTVAIGPERAKKLGLYYEGWPVERAKTASGITSARIGYLDEVEVQGVSARHVQCAVIDGLAAEDGLLGLSFLALFDMTTDKTKHVLQLVDHRAQP
jgi:aspartyl protease family protein